jgi:uncharacterized protein
LTEKSASHYNSSVACPICLYDLGGQRAWPVGTGSQGDQRSLKMQFNVAQLLQEPIGATRRYELAIDPQELDALDPELAFLTPLTGNVLLLRTNSGVLVTAQLHTMVEATCSRCLEPVGWAIDLELEESFHPLTEVHTGRFIPPQQFEGTEDELMDAALIIDDHHILDISEVVRQNIWLALPMYPGCIWDDPDRCPNYEQRLQEMEEAHSDLAQSEADEETANVDPRWATLLALRDRLGDES